MPYFPPNLRPDGSVIGAQAQAQQFANGITTNGAMVDTYQLTLNQSIDSNGLIINGYDDRSADYVKIGVNGGGSGFFFTTANMLYYCNGTALSFLSDNASGIIRFQNASSGVGLQMDQNLQVGIGGITTMTSWLHIKASSAARGQLRFDPTSAADPTSPQDGGMWYNSRLKFHRGSTTELVATGVQGTGGAATAGIVYTATEQAMLQAVYDVARIFGLLT